MYLAFLVMFWRMVTLKSPNLIYSRKPLTFLGFSQLASTFLYYKHTTIYQIFVRFLFLLLNYELQVGRDMSLSLSFLFFLSFVSCFRRISLFQKQKLKLMFNRHVYIWMCVKSFESSSHKYYYHDSYCFRFPLLK